MSVLIKGMDMPTTCCECRFRIYDPNVYWEDGDRKTKGAWVCLLNSELINNTKREDYCSLEAVPPHGRLIDADELAGMFDYEGWTESAIAVEGAPTIMVGVRKGKR